MAEARKPKTANRTEPALTEAKGCHRRQVNVTKENTRVLGN